MIEVIDNLFSEQLIQRAFEHLDHYIKWDTLADSPDDQLSYTLGRTFSPDEYEPIALEFLSEIGLDSIPRKCLYNCFRHGDCPKPHVDSFVDAGITYLIYVNPDWSIEMGGETVFANECGDIIKSVLPMPGRMIKFKSTIPHLARPPVRDGYPRRYSIVFQTHPTDDMILGDFL